MNIWDKECLVIDTGHDRVDDRFDEDEVEFIRSRVEPVRLAVDETMWILLFLTDALCEKVNR